jgi:hypothetical protein
VDTVCRRTGDGIGGVVNATHADGQVQGQRVAGSGTVTIRGHHDHLVTGLTQMPGQHSDALGIDAIIVGN